MTSGTDKSGTCPVCNRRRLFDLVTAYGRQMRTTGEAGREASGRFSDAMGDADRLYAEIETLVRDMEAS